MNDTIRTARAVLRNGITWAIAWGLAGGALFAVLVLFAPGPEPLSIVERVWRAGLAGVAWSVRFGLAGAVIGTLFSLVVRIGYRSRRIADISPLRFAALGAVVGAVGVPLFYQAMNIIADGAPIAWGLVIDDARWASVFGAAVAGGSILVARRAAQLPSEERPEELEQANEIESLPAGAGGVKSLVNRFLAVRH